MNQKLFKWVISDKICYYGNTMGGSGLEHSLRYRLIGDFCDYAAHTKSAI